MCVYIYMRERDRERGEGERRIYLKELIHENIEAGKSKIYGGWVWQGVVGWQAGDMRRTDVEVQV